MKGNHMCISGAVFNTLQLLHKWVPYTVCVKLYVQRHFQTTDII